MDTSGFAPVNRYQSAMESIADKYDSSSEPSSTPLKEMASTVDVKTRVTSSTEMHSGSNILHPQSTPVSIGTPPVPVNDDDEAAMHQQYHQVKAWCRQHINHGSDFLYNPNLFSTTLKSASQEFQFPLESLRSFFNNLYVQHLKSTMFRVRNNYESYLEQYRNNRSILQLAQEAKFSSYFMARLMIEHIAVPAAAVEDKKKFVTAAVRDPLQHLKSLECIREEYRATEAEWAKKQEEDLATTTTRLATEVKEAVDADPLSGPRSDRAKHFVGIEFEVALEHMLRERGISFESETQLREKGTSKTPDVVLSCPIAVQVGSQWRIVNWIDSKALFGDADTHRQSVLPQCESYVHRFGPGMILYFFGHAPLSMLGDGNGDLVIMGWELPKTFMWPTGALSSDNST